MRDEVFLVVSSILVIISVPSLLFFLVLKKMKKNEYVHFLHGGIMELVNGIAICYILIYADYVTKKGSELFKMQVMVTVMSIIFILHYLKRYIASVVKQWIQKIIIGNALLFVVLIIGSHFVPILIQSHIKYYLAFLYVEIILILCLILKEYNGHKKYKKNFIPIYIFLLCALCEIFNLIFYEKYMQICFLVGFFVYAAYQLYGVYQIMRNSARHISTTNEIQKSIFHNTESELISNIQPQLLHDFLVGIAMECDKNPGKAAEDISLFALFLRGNLDSISYTENIPIERELDHVEVYINFEKMRYGNSIEYSVNRKEEKIFLPALTIQKLCELMIRVYVVERRANCRIIVTINEHKNSFEITVFGEETGAFQTKEISIEEIEPVVRNVRARLGEYCQGTLMAMPLKGKGIKYKIIIEKADKEEEHANHSC